MSVLREQLLEGRAVVVAGPLRTAVCDALLALGARLELLDDLTEESAIAWAGERAPLDALVYDAAAAFGAGGADGLRTALERGWVASRAVATAAMIEQQKAGKIILLAPHQQAGTHAEAARAALENLARTLSVEWARYAITTTMIAPGEAATDEQLAMLVAYLVSPAGDYFSGCRFELGSVQLHTARE